jgi:hypothetical protein
MRIADPLQALKRDQAYAQSYIRLFSVAPMPIVTTLV